MPFDPAIPAAHAPITSAELRAQFNGLKALIDAVPAGATVEQLNDAFHALSQDITALDAALVTQIASTANNPGAVNELGLDVSDPPTREEVQAIVDKLDELITALRRD